MALALVACPRGQLVEPIGRRVYPAAVLAGSKTLRRGPSKCPKRRLSGQLGIDHQGATLHLQAQLTLSRSTLAIAIGHGDQFFAAVFCSPRQHQNALRVFLRADVDRVSRLCNERGYLQTHDGVCSEPEDLACIAVAGRRSFSREGAAHRAKRR